MNLTHNTAIYLKGCASKNGTMSSGVALNGATPPSSPSVVGHECPKSLIVYPLTTARVSPGEQTHTLSVVSSCGCEMLVGSIGSAYPSRAAHASRYSVMGGRASVEKGWCWYWQIYWNRLDVG